MDAAVVLGFVTPACQEIVHTLMLVHLNPPQVNPSQAAGGDHRNFGTLVLRPAQLGAQPNEAPITVIISGVGRSGTSMTAHIAHALGISMGKTENEAVYEDKEFVSALLYFDHTLTRQLIDSRNEQSQRWGFKFASLQNHLLPPQLSLFRNPHLIVVMRDPVSVATRAHLSDESPTDAGRAFFNVCHQAFDMAHFVEKAECPTLLLSYEKCVAFPDKAIEAIAGFCGITLTPSLRQAAHTAITPNNPAYIKLFHHGYRGHVDGLLDGQLVGWCKSNLTDAPVALELLANGVVVASFTADRFRADLQQAGVGAGRHSFAFDMQGIGLDKDALLKVRTKGGDFTLPGGGVSLAAYQARVTSA
jgi:hypothetical protein